MADSERSTRGRARRALEAILYGAAALAGIALLAALSGALWLRAEVRASLPQLEGERALRGLAGRVLVERDALGVPTIRGSNRVDVARATGFVHAQDRFFQMDLLRRRAAGELAEILGPALLPLDRKNRVHRFRAEARRVFEQASSVERALVEAYTGGVNAGLASLRARPFEYLVLRAEPAPWKPEDTVLVALSMFIELQESDGAYESTMGLLHDLLPAPLAGFLAPAGTEWDAPIEGEPFGSPPVPGPEVLDLRKAPKKDPVAGLAPPSRASRGMAWAGQTRDSETGIVTGSSWSVEAATALGDTGRPGPIEDPSADLLDFSPQAASNNWAVAGSRTASGGALLAVDMHLGLTVPNTWYRASFSWPAEEGSSEPHRITGVTLPGTPFMVAGSNGRFAWGFTNTQGDWNDLVIVEVDPKDAGAYLTSEGPRAFSRQTEQIHVKGRPDETLEVLEAAWGPIIDKDHRGRPRALRWVAHDEAAVNLHIVTLETARNLAEGLELAERCGVPAQNLVAADSSGRIGWTIAGIIPRRAGFDGRLPVSWADGTRRWDGWLAPEEYPRIVDPESGRLWTANARVAGGKMLETIGDGGYVLGARAKQIRDDLFALERATAHDMLDVQLDDRAIFLNRWRDLLLRVLTPEAVSANPRRRELRRFVEAWEGRASTGSVGYRLVRLFRLLLNDQALGALTAPCKAADSRFEIGRLYQSEGALWKLVTERPEHLLDPRYKSWDEQCLAAVDAALDSLLKDGSHLAAHTWGERNISRIQHPLSLGVPFLGRWLDMPRASLPGDNHMPRVQGPNFGASERMVVTPGREEEGFFHMPCGQSGHPLSPHYGDGHAAWARGEPTSFLPGPVVHTLTLLPDDSAPGR